MNKQFNIEKTFWTDLNNLRTISKLSVFSLYSRYTVPSIDEDVVEKCYVVRCEDVNVFLGAYAGRELKFHILENESEDLNPTLTASVWVDKVGTCHEADEVTHRFLEYLTSQGYIKNVVFSEMQQEVDEKVGEEDIFNQVLTTDQDFNVRVLVSTLVEAGYQVTIEEVTKLTKDGVETMVNATVTVDGHSLPMYVEDDLIRNPSNVMLSKVIEGKPQNFGSHSRSLVWRDLVTRWLKEGLDMDVIF